MKGTGKSQKEGQRKNSKKKAGQKDKGSGLRKLNSKSAHWGAEENMEGRKKKKWKGKKHRKQIREKWYD